LVTVARNYMAVCCLHGCAFDYVVVVLFIYYIVMCDVVIISDCLIFSCFIVCLLVHSVVLLFNLFVIYSCRCFVV